MEPRDRGAQGVSAASTDAGTGARRWPRRACACGGYAAILTRVRFAQSAGRMVADTKFDLVTEPAPVPGRRAAPVGPVGRVRPAAEPGLRLRLADGAVLLAGRAGAPAAVGDPAAVVGLLLCLAFFGDRPAGPASSTSARPATQVLAGVRVRAHARGSPRCSAGCRSRSGRWRWRRGCCCRWCTPASAGSVRRAAALSALVVATCGGVNAVAVAAVLPLGRDLDPDPGARARGSGGCWAGGRCSPALATAWWWVPLLLLGRYSPPFLDYIENATITTVPTGLARTLVGDLRLGRLLRRHRLPGRPAAGHHPVPDARRRRRRRAGPGRHRAARQPAPALPDPRPADRLALVGFGYSGDLAGFFAADRTEAARRRAGAVPQPAQVRRRAAHPAGARAGARAGGAARRCCAAPESPGGARARSSRCARWRCSRWSRWRCRGRRTEIAPRAGVDAVPALLVPTRPTTSPSTTTTARSRSRCPPSAFGVYTWGNTHDDVLQGLADSPWAVRNVIPLAQPGNVVFLDAVTRVVESGHAQPTPSRRTSPPTASAGSWSATTSTGSRPAPPTRRTCRSVLSQSRRASSWSARSARRSAPRPYAVNGDGPGPAWSPATA